MDETDPEKHVALMVDEWGTWWDEEEGTVKGHLYQQNSMRDAMVAALMLNVFHKYTDRVKMANIAQVVNVLQAMILTDQKDKGHMVLTPTYHVFQMYQGFQEATHLPLDIQCDSLTTTEGKKVPALSASAARQKDGSLILSLANTRLDKEQTITVSLSGTEAKTAEGSILTSKNVADYNDFEHPEVVKPQPYKDAKIKKNQLTVKLPAKSIVVLNLK